MTKRAEALALALTEEERRTPARVRCLMNPCAETAADVLFGILEHGLHDETTSRRPGNGREDSEHLGVCCPVVEFAPQENFFGTYRHRKIFLTLPQNIGNPLPGNSPFNLTPAC